MAEDELTKREFLTAAAVLGGGAVVGYAARDATQPERAMLGGGGGGPSATERLHIKTNEILSPSQSAWYGSVLWEDSGELLLEDGDGIGLVDLSEDV